MLHLRVGLVLTALGLMVACGDDDASTTDAGVGAAGSGQTAGSGKAGSGGVMLRDAGMSTESGGTGGDTTTGAIPEGMLCDATHLCAPELSCVSIGDEEGVCARPCTPGPDAAAECEGGEVCAGYTDRPEDQHCVNLEDKQWGFCGPNETADCASPLLCVPIPDDESTPEVEVLGICIQECIPNGDADAGLEMSTCPDGQVCLPDGAAGFCANLVERGGECSLGNFCEDETDRCLPDSLKDIPNATLRCQQDCTAPDTVCEVGECVGVRNTATGETFSFCLDEK